MSDANNLGEGAPVVEALIDIQCSISPAVADELLRKFEDLYNSIKTEFPVREHKISQTFSFNLKENTLEAKTHKNGYQYRNIPKGELAQFRLDGFTFNKLAPYSDWTAVIREAKKYWQLYSDLANPEIKRIATRFINRFDIMWPITDDSYVKRVTSPATAPQTTSSIVQFLDSKLSRCADGTLVNVIQAVKDPPPEGQRAVYTLDIDVHRMGNFDPNDMWAFFDRFRDLKNETFRDYVGDKAMEEFKERSQKGNS